MVMDLLAKAGKRFTLYGRDLSKKAEFGFGKRNYNSVAGEAFWIENSGDKRRHATLSDVATATRFADALEQITIPGAMSDPYELPVEWRCVTVAAEMIKNTTKPSRVRKQAILDSHQVEPLSRDIARELDKIAATARKNLQQ